VKVNEFRELEEDQLGDRLRAARRELYELRFKHAVGQLENSSQISKVRHDIARIMTVITERELGLAPVPVHDDAPVGSSRADGAGTPVDEGFEPESAVAEEPVAASVEEAPKAKRVRKAKTEEKS
jgi:large subunit ribosomal protein L29